MAKSSLWLTAAETLDVVARCEPRHRLTYARLRYWDDQGIVPASRMYERGARLYGSDDVAMLRLAVRVMADGRTLRQVSEALRYCNAAIRAAFRSTRPLVLTFDTRGRAEVRPIHEVPIGADVYALASCYEGVEDAMSERRSEEPEIWTGWSYVPAATVRAPEALMV